MNKEIKIEGDGNRVIIYNEGKDGSLYERTIYLQDKEEDDEKKSEIDKEN